MCNDPKGMPSLGMMQSRGKMSQTVFCLCFAFFFRPELDMFLECGL